MGDRDSRHRMDERHLRAASIGAPSDHLTLDQRRRLVLRPGYAARRIASPTSREKRKPGTGRALAAFDGDLRPRTSNG